MGIIRKYDKYKEKSYQEYIDSIFEIKYKDRERTVTTTQAIAFRKNSEVIDAIKNVKEQVCKDYINKILNERMSDIEKIDIEPFNYFIENYPSNLKYIEFKEFNLVYIFDPEIESYTIYEKTQKSNEDSQQN